MTSLRSPLGRALGTGSARSGSAHWWTQRVTAVALIPLTLWFLFSLLLLPDLEYLSVRAWLAAPFSGFLAMLLIAVLAWHAELGTRVVVEDYVHSAGIRVLTLLLLRFAYVLAAGLGVLAVLRIVFAAPMP
ncbi:MAG: succinate dehydrogenase, hydrophobic membrane anchor protein [Steroidobacterales bacterium]